MTTQSCLNRNPRSALFASAMVLATTACAAQNDRAGNSKGHDATGNGSPTLLKFELAFKTSASAPAPCSLQPRSVSLNTLAPSTQQGELAFHLWAATLAYADKAEIESQAIAAGFQSVTFLDQSQAEGKGKSGFQAYVAHRPGMKLLAIRGSNEAADWIDNGNELTRLGLPLGLPGWIHSGFSNQLESGWNDVKAALAKGNAADPIYVTGHSLGGALSTLYGARLARGGGNVKSVVTFAAPRAGDETFAKVTNEQLGARLVRVARLDDVVSHIPVGSAHAELGARLAKPNAPDSVIAADALRISKSRYVHAGRFFELDPSSGAMTSKPEQTVAEETAYLTKLLAETLDAAQKGDAAKAALDAKNSAAHVPAGYVCPVFGSKS